ncbi:MAG: 6-phosphofructokinase [Coriobacteriales bacterium]|nr:6-phosphofructokinase [Coriobacteriales bacterium]
MAWNTNVLVGQSGGPTAAINASLAGVFDTARDLGAHVLGMRYGIEGFLNGRIVHLDRTLGDPMDVELLRRTPSSFLGSCRFKLPTPEQDPAFFEDAFAKFKAARVGAVLYIGGNDSMDTIGKLAQWGDAHGSDIRFIGIPKTIDNDLVGTDHTPGYGSAAKYIATSMREILRDSSVYDLKSVTFVEIMGRDTGWLTGSACLAGETGAPCPDLVLLPEVTMNQEALLERLSQLLSRKNTVVVAVSEGVRHRDGTLLCEAAAEAADGTRLDAFGHVASLSGTGRYLASLTRAKLGCKTRAIELSTLQRCASHVASATDLAEAYSLGGAGVIAANNGSTAVMSAIERIFDKPYLYNTTLTPIADVANQVRTVPLDFISPDGMGVTAAFERYARPLIEGEISSTYQGGVPHHITALDANRA